MRIVRLVLRNYRQFRNEEVTFLKKEAQNDLHVVIGLMGTGKTNVLNAVNWCLYREEPHLSKKSQQLPVLNIGLIENGTPGNREETSVEIWTEARDGRQIIFSRREAFTLRAVGQEPLRSDMEFEVKVIEANGDTEIYKGEEAEAFVERFVPLRIREFFLFDGERLDQYFKEATSQHIQNAIYSVAQIDTLKGMGERLSTVLKEYRREAGKASPEIEETRKKLEETSTRLASIKLDIETCKKQIQTAKEKVDDYEDKLRGIPNIRDLTSERKRLENKEKEIEKRVDDITAEKHRLILESAKSLFAYPALRSMINTINEKRKKKELPPPLDAHLLEHIIESKKCTVCGRSFKSDDEVHEHIDKILNSIRVSSEVASELREIENPLLRHERRSKTARRRLEGFASDLRRLSQDISDAQERIKEINADVAGYDNDKIKTWHEGLSTFKALHTDNQRKLAAHKVTEKSLKKEKEELDRALKEELAKQEKLKELSKYIDFTDSALRTVEETREEIADRMRKQIEQKTSAKFSDLHWKETTYKEVAIDDSFDIHLIHRSGYDALGTTSGGERETLALAFTISLHEVSGFDSPMLIDRPLAMVSGEPVENITKILTDISKDRQIILLLTPNDYTEEVAGIVDPIASSRCKLHLSADESEARAELI